MLDALPTGSWGRLGSPIREGEQRFPRRRLGSYTNSNALGVNFLVGGSRELGDPRLQPRSLPLQRRRPLLKPLHMLGELV